MSSNKTTTKWSSSSSLTKLFTRITRTLSFTSKKSQQTLKTNKNKKIKPIEPVIKNVHFVPQSAPIIRRNLPSQPISKILYNEHSNKQLIYRNMYVDIDIEEETDDDDDYSRYSLRPNLSLLNISVDNIHSQSEEFYQRVPKQEEWLDDIFHSTKIDDFLKKTIFFVLVFFLFLIK